MRDRLCWKCDGRGHTHMTALGERVRCNLCGGRGWLDSRGPLDERGLLRSVRPSVPPNQPSLFSEET